MIDLVIFIVVQLIVGAALRHSNALTLHFTTTMHNGTIHHNRVDFLVYIITLVLAIIYATVLFGGKRGQTVGMMAVGVRGLSGDHGGPVGYGRAFWRSLLGWNYKFSQANWDPQNLNQTTLQVLYDPGWPFKWTGSIGICAGITLMFYFMPRRSAKERRENTDAT